MTEYNTSTDDLAASETPSLIAASKVNGTKVYGPEGKFVRDDLRRHD